MRIRTAFGVAGTTLALLTTIPVGAYNGPTHSAITQRALAHVFQVTDQSIKNLGWTRGLGQSLVGDGVTRSAQEWIVDGSIDEDKPGLRAFNHFHSPLRSDLAAGLSSSIVVVMTNSSIVWAQFGLQKQSTYLGGAGGDHAWQDARNTFLLALTSADSSDRDQMLHATLYTLGHQMHLVQDASVPSHVRDDPHGDFCGVFGIQLIPWPLCNPDPFHAWMDQHLDLVGNSIVLDPAASLLTSPPMNPSTRAAGTTAPIANLIDTHASSPTLPDATLSTNVGIAEFANANFYSLDTIGPNVTHPASVPQPNPSAPGSFDTPIFTDPQRGADYAKLVRNHGVQIQHLARFSVLNWPIFTLDDAVYQDYAERLMPRAIGYSAALLAYFFRGALTAQAAPNGALNVANTSPEDMTGTFSMYYDDINDVRHAVTGATWQLMIARGGTSAGLVFTVPTAPTPKVPAQYTLVFSGTLGSEPGAVVGTTVTLQTPSLSVGISGNGTVTITPPGITCAITCTTIIRTAQPVTLTAAAGQSYSFGGWMTCGFANQPPFSTSPTITLSVTANMSICALFSPAVAASITAASCANSSALGILELDISASGTLQGPEGFTAEIRAGYLSNLNPNSLHYEDSSLLHFDCGSWTASTTELGLTCQRPSGGPNTTNWSITKLEHWGTLLLQLPGEVKALRFPNTTNIPLTSQTISCTQQ